MEFAFYTILVIIFAAALLIIVTSGAFELCVPKKWGVIAITVFLSAGISGASLCSGKAIYFQARLLPNSVAIPLLILSVIGFAIMLAKKCEDEMRSEEALKAKEEAVMDKNYPNNLD